MRIYIPETDQVYSRVFLFLKSDELDLMIEYLEELRDHPEQTHVHYQKLDDGEDFGKEIVMSLYTEDNLNQFDERSRKAILEDK